MSAVPTIRRDSASYRQGLVLGLTMAETMLLLVFCLLMAAAIVFGRKSAELKAVRADNQALTSVVELMKSRLPAGGEIAADWQHLKEKAIAIEALEKHGISVEEAAEAAPFIAEMMETYKIGGAAGDVTGSIVLGEAIKKEFQSKPNGVPNDKEIVSILREGMQAQTATAHPQSDGKHKWPPIITISDPEGNYFATASAVLSEKFRTDLNGSIMEDLLRNIEAYPDVNVIEVIGHTDERPLGGPFSNLDSVLMPVLQRKESVARLRPADNAGLGLARAVSVTQVLLAEKRLARFKSAILPYSGAQLVNVNDSLVLDGTGGDVKERRRIEIRLRQSDKIDLPVAAPVAPPWSERAKKSAAAPSKSPGEVDTAVAQPTPALPEPIQPVAKPRPAPKPGGVKTPFGRFFRN
jgi:hypothetical protein